MTRPALLLLAASLSCGASACATSRPGSPVDVDPAASGATLEVENRTQEDLLVSVRGRVEGTVRSGQRLRVRHLGPGEVGVQARSTMGGDGAFTSGTRLELVGGAIVAWSILPDAAGGEPLPEVPGLGALRVVNPSQRSVVISVAGVRRGRIFAGDERLVEDLPEGAAEIVAQPDDGTAPSRDTVAIVAGTTASWRFEQVGARLTVVNETDEAIVVRIDEAERTRIAPGERWTSTEAPGLRMLSARSEPSLRPYEQLLELALDQEATWSVTAGQAALVVDNATGEAISLAVPDHPAMTLAPRQRERFEGMPTGATAIEARGQDTQTIYAVELELLPGQETTWVAAPVAGSIRVDNRTPRTLTIYTGSELDEQERGELAPNTTALVRQLPRTAIRVSAVSVDPSGVARRQSTTFDLSSTPAATWVVSPVTGPLEVDNGGEDTVEVYVDARRVGDIERGAKRIFTGLEVGPRRIECVGQRTGHVQRDDVVVSEEAVARVAIQPTSAWLVIANVTGEDLVTRGQLAGQLPHVDAGGSVRFKVRAGPQRVTLVGAQSGFIYGRQVEVAAGGSERWEVALRSGRVLVANRLAESVAATIDGRAQGSLPPDETLAIEDVAPGRHRVQVVGLRSGLVRSEVVVAKPGDDTKVTFASELGALLVENRAQEAVEVAIDGALYGEVSPTSLHAFGKIGPGAREVELYYTESHRRLVVKLEIREGQRARIVAEAPLGVLVVDNSSHQDVKVTVDGEDASVVPADAGPTLVVAKAGGRHIHVERLGDRTQLGFHLIIEADVAVHVPIPPTSVRLVVVNRGSDALSLFAGDRELGEVTGGGSRMIEDLEHGEARLMAKDAAGHIRYEELKRLHAGETATWVLTAP